MKNGKTMLYISGPMRGIPDFNYPKFNDVASKLRNSGFEVINPAEIADGDQNQTFEYYIKYDLINILSEPIDAIVVLDGWQNSVGACAEVYVAGLIGIKPVKVVEHNNGPCTISPIEPIEENILQEAQRLVYGNRQGDYGHPIDDFTRTAKIWSAILGIEVTAEQMALCMVGVKISRQCNKPKRDNIVDGAGYWATLDLVISEKKRRAELAKNNQKV